MSSTPPQVTSAPTENLAGLVERVTFHNEENGFCVLRLKARGQRDLVTVLGHAAMISAGEWVQAAGTWTNDRTHGLQFRANFLQATAPTTLDGIEKYLASGMVRGIGPAYVKRFDRTFGEAVFEVTEADPSRLREVEGIGPVRAKRIAASWAEQKVVREIMLFLHAHGVGTSRAVRTYKTYGAEAVATITENPYRLACDTRGIGFKTADQVAPKLGIVKDAIVRVRAGVSYALAEAMDEGRRGLPEDDLLRTGAELRWRSPPSASSPPQRRNSPTARYGRCGRGAPVRLPGRPVPCRARHRRRPAEVEEGRRRGPLISELLAEAGVR